MDPSADATAFGGLTPLAGGWSGETFVTDGGDGPVVVRIHARDPDRAEVDAALLRLVQGLVPVPRVLEVRRGDRDADRPGLLVTSFLPGTRGDLVLPRLDRDGLARLGRETGRLAATLAGMPLLRAGAFVGPELQVEPWDLPDGLPGLVTDAVDAGAFEPWDDDARAGLLEVAGAAQDLLDSVERVSVVHSDLNPKNLLVDERTLRVTGLVDWEYAHAGHPFTDLGNLLRFDRAPAYVDAVLAAFEERHGVPPAEALALARAADLWALVDLAGRRGQHPVADRADALLRGVAARRDLGWTPVPGHA